MSIQVYNTLTRQKETFQPLEEKKVKLYVCGPTVYNYVHVGNARVSVFFDVVRRYFEYIGYDVTYVQNLTDVDDKIIQAAKDNNEAELSISTRFAQAYLEDLASLNVKPAHVHPKVSDHMPEIIAFIEGLIANGMAYEVKGDVYYRVEKFSDYGKLSNQRLDTLQHTEREVVQIIDYKENEFDFALWKKQKKSEIAWESPWGLGRPGWHIECSAMSQKYLGDTFDIHGGGMDLCFPHHENEIAQSEGLTGKIPANVWMHNNYVTVDGAKMSKSLGNFTTVRNALQNFDGESIRLFFLSVNYRNPIDFSDEALAQAKSNLERLKNTAFNLAHLASVGSDQTSTFDAESFLNETNEKFHSYMQDDFNSADVVTLLLNFSKTINSKLDEQAVSKEDATRLLEGLQNVGDVLGLTFLTQEENLDEDIQKLVELRDALKEQAKNAPKEEKKALFQRADAIRSELQVKGIILEDTPHGTRWKRK